MDKNETDGLQDSLPTVQEVTVKEEKKQTVGVELVAA